MILPAKAKAYLEDHLVTSNYLLCIVDMHITGWNHGTVGTTRCVKTYSEIKSV